MLDSPIATAAAIATGAAPQVINLFDEATFTARHVGVHVILVRKVTLSKLLI